MHDPVRWLYDLQHFGVKLGLDNIRALLALLGHPESAYPSIHVAGTNGKGSVAAMLSAMLDAAGLRSGLFTSPHLVRPNERIRIGGRDITTPELHRLLDGMRTRIDRGLADGELQAHPSFFEVITATALTAFRDAEVRAAVLEVGLGGRLDATNAVDGRVSVIVSVELDHTKTLGPTLERIAAEKAGIVKHGRPLVSGVERENALAVVREVCRERRAPLIDAREVATIAADDDGTFRLRTARADYRRLRIALAGAHQRGNARIAVVAFEALLEDLGRGPDPDAVRRGLAEVRWPGRLQWIEGDPPLLLDGAHNPAGAETLAAYLRERVAREGTATTDGFHVLQAAVKARPVLLFGAMRGKDLEGILAPLRGLVGAAVVARPGVERAAEPAEVLEAAQRVLGAAERVDEPERAFERARELARPGGWVLVAGSLYLVGQVLGLLEREPVPGPVSM